MSEEKRQQGDLTEKNFDPGPYSMMQHLRISREEKILNTGFDKWSSVEFRINETVFRYVYENEGSRWRIKTLFDKEPATLAWLNKFKTGEVFIDIGANVGMYSIWAAAMTGARVIAFEPESQNYGMLNRNICANGFHQNDQVVAYCAAVMARPEVSKLFVSACSTGVSFNDFGKRIEGRGTNFVQGSMAVSIDQLVSTGQIPIPQHIKIDVDGYEHLVVDGCKGVIESGALKSILIEIDRADPDHVAIVEYLGALGFTYSPDQVEAPRAMPIPSNATTRNYIFYKDPEYRVL